MKKDTICSFYGNPTQGQGYSGSAEHLMIELNKLMDVRLSVIVPSKNQAKRLIVSKKNRTKEGNLIASKPFVMGKMGLSYGFPTSFNSIMNKHKIGFTMFETDTLPNGKTTKYGNPWSGKTGKASDIINKLDLLIVPCHHNKQIFEKSGVTIPIEVCNLGIDPKQYPCIERPKRKMFTFYMSGTLTTRKNYGMVIHAFMELFSGRKDVRLVLKTQQGTIPNFIQFDNVNIEIIDEYATPERMLELLYEADAFVFPSRGEGFGLTPLEAMATGLPTIVSNNTGMSEYAHKDYAYKIPTKKKIKAKCFPKLWGNVGKYYEPDFDVLKKYMMEVYTNRKSSKEIGKKASKWVHKYWTYEQSAKRLVEILDKHFN